MDKVIGFKDFGKIAWLWNNSPMHKSWRVHLQTRFIVPALETGQYILIEEKGLPVAYCSWAYLSLEIANEMVLKPGHLRRPDWNSGDHMWVIDWVSPFSSKNTWKLRNKLALMFPERIVRAIRVKTDYSPSRILHFSGPQVSSKRSEIERMGFNTQLVQYLKNHPEVGKDFRLNSIEKS